jgi:hypothetical protein
MGSVACELKISDVTSLHRDRGDKQAEKHQAEQNSLARDNSWRGLGGKELEWQLGRTSLEYNNKNQWQ